MTESNERIAKLEVEVSHLRSDTTEIKGDVKKLLEFKWRIYGATAFIAVFFAGMVEVLARVGH